MKKLFYSFVLLGLAGIGWSLTVTHTGDLALTADSITATGTSTLSTLSAITLDVTGNERIAGNLTITGTTGATGVASLSMISGTGVDVTGNLRVSGTGAITGVSSLNMISGTGVDVTGNVRVTGTANVAGVTTLKEVTGNGNITMAADISGTNTKVAVSSVTCSATLGVTGVASLSMISGTGLDVTGNERVTGSSTISGNAVISSDLTVDNYATFTSSLTSPSVIMTGGITIYSRTEDQLKTLTAGVVGNLYFDTDNVQLLISTGTAQGAFGKVADGGAPTGW